MKKRVLGGLAVVLVVGCTPPHKGFRDRLTRSGSLPAVPLVADLVEIPEDIVVRAEPIDPAANAFLQLPRVSSRGETWLPRTLSSRDLSLNWSTDRKRVLVKGSVQWNNPTTKAAGDVAIVLAGDWSSDSGSADLVPVTSAMNNMSKAADVRGRLYCLATDEEGLCDSFIVELFARVDGVIYSGQVEKMSTAKKEAPSDLEPSASDEPEINDEVPGFDEDWEVVGTNERELDALFGRDPIDKEHDEMPTAPLPQPLPPSEKAPESPLPPPPSDLELDESMDWWRKNPQGLHPSEDVSRGQTQAPPHAVSPSVSATPTAAPEILLPVAPAPTSKAKDPGGKNPRLSPSPGGDAPLAPVIPTPAPVVSPISTPTVSPTPTPTSTPTVSPQASQTPKVTPRATPSAPAVPSPAVSSPQPVATSTPSPKPTLTSTPVPTSTALPAPVVPTEPPSEQEAQTLIELKYKDQSVGAHSRGSLRQPTNLKAVVDKMGERSRIRVIHPNQRRYFGNYATIEFLVKSSVLLNRLAPGTFLEVGDISSEKGGHLRPHKSHQNGLDIDVGFFFEGVTKGYYGWNSIKGKSLNPQFARALSWKFFKTMMTYYHDKVYFILVHPSVKKAMCEEAVSSGDIVKGKEMDPIIFHTLRRIVPERSHDNHFHVRLKCPTKDSRCVQTKRDLAVTTGCFAKK